METLAFDGLLDQVDAWRLETLLAAGYSLAEAEHLAADRDVDLHRAVELVAAGCPPTTAVQILT